MHRLAHVELDPEYKHYHYYPHIMFGKMRLFSWMEWTIPLSPQRTRVVGTFFCHGGSNSLKSRILTRVLAKWEKKFFTKLMHEDCAAMTEVQHGLNSPRRPSSGMISIREERCFHFQTYIRQTTSRELQLVKATEMAVGA